jgi:hypothetical protein
MEYFVVPTVGKSTKYGFTPAFGVGGGIGGVGGTGVGGSGGVGYGSFLPPSVIPRIRASNKTATTATIFHL